MEDTRKRGIDFLGLQETDKAAVIQQTAKLYGYRAFSNQYVTTLVDMEWEQYVVRTTSAFGGRLLLIWLDFNESTCLLATAYLPTGLDGKSDGSGDVKLAVKISTRIKARQAK
jgi:hypothetical protein